MLSPFRKRTIETAGPQKPTTTELPLPTKEQGLINRLVAEQEKADKKDLWAKTRGRRRRTSSIEGANNIMMMSLVPGPPSETGDRPQLSIVKEFIREVAHGNTAVRPRTMSLEKVERRKSKEWMPLADRRKSLKSSRSSKSLSPGQPRKEQLVSPHQFPAPPPPTPRSPVIEPSPGDVAKRNDELNEKELDALRVSPEPLQTVSVGTSPRTRFTFFRGRKTQTEPEKRDDTSPVQKLGEIFGIHFGRGKDAGKVTGKFKRFAHGIRTLERLKGVQKREAEQLKALVHSGIPDQKKLLETLLEHDHYKHDFNGFLRQYYSYVLRCHCLMNMQGRYRGLSRSPECFKLIDISQLRTKSEELLRRKQQKEAKREVELNKLRHVARDSLHYRFLKEMWENQALTLPITVMYSILAEVTPVIEGIWRQYMAHLGRLHQTSNQCGRHFLRLKQRLEMYEHLRLGDEYEDTGKGN